MISFVSLLACPGGVGFLLKIKMQFSWKRTSLNKLTKTKFQDSGNDWCDFSSRLLGEPLIFKISGHRTVLGVHQRLKVHSYRKLPWIAYGGGKVR